MVYMPIEEEKQNKDYLVGSKGTLLEIELPGRLINEFKNFCKEFADGNLVLGFEKLLSRVRFDSKTELLVERDNELLALIQNLDSKIKELEQAENKPSVVKTFGSAHIKTTGESQNE